MTMPNMQAISISIKSSNTSERNQRLFHIFRFPGIRSALALFRCPVFTGEVGQNLASHLAGEDPGHPDRASLETDSGKAGGWVIASGKKVTGLVPRF
jgi:hypothetical protein